ncbi:hypothetical protein ACJQWK_09055 [Exserohilum turcicum]|uniref:Uncharacterized protein n=1 Tax=Exserohilum turcicum (strain 28A) TaxID=671987 RepID=R0IR18_EXST2|nr:uncharacterized protein SETTUDRAFT_41550 [Exserohilum turcica Et28A]EOA87116.1 hypothetical protein SETTUDRAFT_41550 [Exserohilum turcica Et28A]
MSTTPAPSAPADKSKNGDRSSLGKYVKRMSTVFKRDRSSKNQPPALSPDAPPQPPQPQPQPQQLPQQQQQLPQQPPTIETAEKTTQTDQLPSPPLPVPTHVDTPPAPVPKAMDRNAMQQERARALFAKYGLTLESHEWIAAPAAPSTVERVEKPIRMRVHRSCHRCGTLYGSDRTCVQCEHRRCKKCPRYPKKKTPEEKQADKDPNEPPKRKRMLTIRTRTGDELVYQPARQRIRRTCHKCSTLFVPATATVCQNCQHLRCTRCAREPAKFTKWPTGYPGDAEPDSETEVDKQLETFRRTWRKPRTRVRWQCEQCNSLFQNHSPQCPGCSHMRCDQCTRSPVKKPKTGEQFDAQVVAAVEAKLRAMGVDDEVSSGAETI